MIMYDLQIFKLSSKTCGNISKVTIFKTFSIKKLNHRETCYRRSKCCTSSLIMSSAMSL